jgi:hypothetical protein
VFLKFLLLQNKIIKKEETVFDGTALFCMDHKLSNKCVSSSAEILRKLRMRKSIDTHSINQNILEQFVDATIEETSDVELITDIKDYIKLGAAVNGQATTKEIVDQFRSNLPPEKTINFKSMLKQICTFDNKSGIGIWSLKTEFR